MHDSLLRSASDLYAECSASSGAEVKFNRRLGGGEPSAKPCFPLPPEVSAKSVISLSPEK
jgi:hypothetical protein